MPEINNNRQPVLWNENKYLSKNHDVAIAIKNGIIKSGWLHYSKYGKYEEDRETGFISRKEYLKRNRKIKTLKKELKNGLIKINYVIACWSGERRRGNDKYELDRTRYLKEHLKSLHHLKHNLSQITVVVAEDEDEPSDFTQFIKDIPNRIKTTPVVVERRENKGQSYGSYSHVYGMYRTKFQYYIFIEDDYLFVKDNFDLEMMEQIESDSNCGFLCSLVFPGATKKDQPHAAIANGISRSTILEKIWKKNNCLPHGDEEGFTYSASPQLEFSWAFLDVGAELYDTLNNYRAAFNEAGRLIYFGDRKKDDLIIPVQFIEYLRKC